MQDEPKVPVGYDVDFLYVWSARKVQPIVLVWLALIFLVAMALVLLTVHSREAVMALLAAGATAIGSAAPGVVNRTDYRATAEVLEKMPPAKKKKREFASVFRWDELSHVKPGKHNVKYYKHLDEPNALKRFWKLHVSDAYSGEFHIEKHNRDDVLALLERLGVATSRPDPS